MPVVKREPNYVKAAFLVPANLFALAAAAIAAVVVGDPTPLLVALGVESLYLGVLTATPGFRRAIRANFHAPELSTGDPLEIDALLEELAPSQREHYFALRELRDKILANHKKLPGGRIISASSEQRVDQLSIAFLRLLSTLNGYRKYLSATDRKQIEIELAALEKDAAEEKNERLRDVKNKRVEILKKRKLRFEQAEESREVVSHQLAGIEDLLRLTHEQSIAIRDPELVGRQLDALAAEIESTEETVREMEKFMEFTDEIGSHVPQGTRVR
jgi:hypothetical protein